MIFRQLIEPQSSTYTYLLADEKTKEGIIIDTVLETADRDFTLIQELGIKLQWILDTHVHADHITGAAVLREKTGAKTGLGKATGLACADRLFDDGETFQVGSMNIKVLSTPGHTNGCHCFLVNGKMIFTGDTLLIRGCGRTDFQEGSAEKLFDSVRAKIFTLPDETVIYPAHDYQNRTHTTVGEEKELNPRLKLSHNKADFVKIMSELKLDRPKQIDRAVPANLNCGKI
jgi:sulfur dioxygenase